MEAEQSLIKPNSGLLTLLHKGGLTFEVLPKELLVLECLVAGTSFRKLDEIEEELKPEVNLECKREAKNEYDEFAVALYYGEHKTGYIPREKNEVIARLMDAGKQFFAKIKEKEKEGSWLRIELQIFLKD